MGGYGYRDVAFSALQVSCGCSKLTLVTLQQAMSETFPSQQPGRSLGGSALMKGQPLSSVCIKGEQFGLGLIFTQVIAGAGLSSRVKWAGENSAWVQNVSACYLAEMRKAIICLSHRKHSKNDGQLFHLDTHTYPLNFIQWIKLVFGAVNDLLATPICTPYQGYGEECAWKLGRICLLASIAAIDFMLRL